MIINNFLIKKVIKQGKPSFFLNEFEPDFTQQQRSWRPLHLLNLYRLLISGIFASLFFSGMILNPFGNTYPELFEIISLAYFSGSILIGITIRWHWPALWLQTHSHIIFDFCAILLIMHASGGVKSGVGLLLILPIAAISILSFGRISLFYAALITLALFFDQFYLKLTLEIPQAYTQTGLLGATLFITALLSNYLVNKSEESIEIASQREVDLANMEQLTQFIMQRMQTAVIVIDYLGNIKLINHTAKNILQLTDDDLNRHKSLTHASSELAQILQQWQAKTAIQTHKFTLTKDNLEFNIQLASLDHSPKSGTVIFLQDKADIQYEAQQLKLASLGRLSASIAHEIRNPLAAILHSSELLNESKQIDKGDKRLTEIIEVHAIRINEIITTVLELSRRQSAEQEVLNLVQWLNTFFNKEIHLAQEKFILKYTSDHIKVLFDPQHLYQIVNNLVQNALRHNTHKNDHLQPIIINIGIIPNNQIPYLQIINHGSAIPKENLDKIFEPFFTTEASGSGLGLYIAREMTTCNASQLEYIDVEEGPCFQLNFSNSKGMN